MSWNALISRYTHAGKRKEVSFENFSYRICRPEAILTRCTGILTACGNLWVVWKRNTLPAETIADLLLEKDAVFGNDSMEMYDNCGYVNAQLAFDEL